MLKKQSLIGLTYGQVIATLTLAVGMIYGYADIIARITASETNIFNLQTEQAQIKESNERKFRQVFEDSREQFQTLSKKIDQIILK